MSGVDDGQPGLVLRGVSAGYGAGVVLEDVDLAIPPGTLVGVIGPNGS
jgi:ABC-type cobalamin/Fe3+-siderophores transport system ATPase subunit